MVANSNEMCPAESSDYLTVGAWSNRSCEQSQAFCQKDKHRDAHSVSIFAVFVGFVHQLRCPRDRVVHMLLAKQHRLQSPNRLPNYPSFQVH